MSIKLYELRSIYYGNEEKDVNICNPPTNFYQVQNWPPDLSSNTVNFTMKSLKPEAVPDVNMTISILAPGIINLYWKYVTGTQPYEVPSQVVDVNRTDLMDIGVLSDLVTMVQDS